MTDDLAGATSAELADAEMGAGAAGEGAVVSLSPSLSCVDSTDEKGEAENSARCPCGRVRFTSSVELLTTSSPLIMLIGEFGDVLAAATPTVSSRSVCSDLPALALSRRARRAASRISHDGRASGESGVTFCCDDAEAVAGG